MANLLKRPNIKMAKSKMAKNKILLFILLIAGLVSCNHNEPVDFVTWHCTETSLNGQRTYLVDVYKTKDTTVYLFSNFHNVSTEGFYDVKIQFKNNKYSFNPLPQQIGDSKYVIKSGSGTFYPGLNQMIFEYNISDYNGQNEIAVRAVFTR